MEGWTKLFLFSWIFCHYIQQTVQEHREKRQSVNVQPRIVSTDGHLVFQTGENHNITFRSSQGGFINIDGENLNNIVKMVKNAQSLLEQALDGQQDGLSERLSSLESSIQTDKSETSTLIQQLTDRIEALETVTPSPTSAPASSSALSRLTRRVRSLESTVRSIRRNLARKECRSNPCQHGGTCEDAYNGFVCRCPPQWQGNRCDEDVNECSDYAGTDLGCQNGATCTNLPGGYSCQCSAQWHGVRCTESHDDCTGASNEALCGHGTCVNVPRTRPGESKYHCICNEGWTNDGSDPACNTDVNECDSRTPKCSVNPLVTCINLPGSYHCGACPIGYTGNGHACSDLNECLTNNGGCSQAPRVQCINTMGSRTCGQCPPGYTGDGETCSYQGMCSTNNGGCHPLATCQEGNGFSRHSCTCPSGYVGSGQGPSGCTQQGGGDGGEGSSGAGPCANVNCGNGICMVTGYGYRCSCQLGWGGATCLTNINECISSPCGNGGTCNDAVAGYTCSCTDGYTGNNCEITRQACGDRLTQESGNLRYPPVPDQRYPHGANCEWTIITAPNKVLTISFSGFKLESHEDCRYDYVELFDGSPTLSLGRFCGQTIPSARNTTHNRLIVKFRSDASESHDGFEMHWTSTVPECGGSIRSQSHGVISSPGYPGNYPHNRNCVWTIRVSPGRKILLTLGQIALETHPNCTDDFLMIHDGLRERDTMLGRYCSTQNPAPVTTSGPYALLRFHSDEFSSDRGFQINFMEVAGAPGCGGNFTTASGILISPNYPNAYPHRAECIWIIGVQEGERVTLTFTNIDLEDHANCRNDYVEVRDGVDEEADFVGRHCNEIPPAYRSTGNTLWIKLRTDSSVTGSGFRATWDVECGGTFTSPTGELTSPYFPNPYPANKECTYLITPPEGTFITLTFVTFDIEASRSGNCRYDYVEVRNGENEESPLLGRLCGSNIPEHVSSTSNAMWLKFGSDGSVQNHGFRATYSTSEGGTIGGGGGGSDGAAETGACGGALSGMTGLFTSPGHPNTYPHGVNCTWWITVPAGFVIRLTFTQFNLESHRNCNYDNVKVYDNSTETGLIGRYCGSTIPPVVTSQDNVLTVVFASDASVASEGFAAIYTALNATTACGGELRDSVGVISSPLYPENYPHNRQCEWLIVVPGGQQILLNITDFTMEAHNNCLYDYVEIRNGGMSTSPLIGKFCGTTYEPIIRSYSNRMYIKFRSDGSSSGRGFQAIYDGTLSGCGGELTGPTGSFVSPNFPLPYGHNAECFWTITVSRGSQVYLDFASFDLESHSLCAYDYVEVRDEAGGRVLGKFCGTNIPQSIHSPGNTLYVKFRTDYSSGGTGFHASYHSNCNNRLTDHSGVVESPNFPNGYPHARDCTWVIEATLGNTINVTFSHFNMEDHANCSYDYLELRDGEGLSAPLIGRYCGVDMLPPSVASTQRYLLAHLVSDASVSHNGFRMEYIVDGCGGEFRAETGAFTSPNYPEDYPSARECMYRIETPLGTSIELTIQDFDVEQHQDCSYDALEVYGGLDTSSPQLAVLCHTQTSPQTLVSTGNHMLLRFFTDNYRGARGFSVVYRTKTEGCGGNFSVPSGTIMSQNYPHPYPNNTDCTWLISLAPGKFIILTVEDLSLENHAQCNYDYVALYDGPDYNSTELMKACGTSLPDPAVFRSSGNELFIRMRSDNSLSSSGFKMSYVTGCGGLMNAEEDGEIVSPGWPGNYGLMENCTYIIQSQHPGDKVTLTFTHLDIEDIESCAHDSVQVRDGDDVNAPVVGTYCGTTAPAPITSNGAALTVSFSSDSRFVRSGFRAVYTKSTSSCGGTFTSENGAFNSPGYPDTYPHNVECVWNIVTSPGNKIGLSFSMLSLEDEELCNNDFVEVRDGGPSGVVLSRFCGTTLPNNITTGSNLWVMFRSNEDVPGQGFRAQYNSLYGGDLVGNSGELASPMYPADYPANAHYVWTITVDTDKRIQITFRVLDIETEPMCLYDFVRIQDGGSADSPQIGSYCGIVPPSRLVSRGNQVRVIFNSDPAVAGRGFMLEWQATTDMAYVPTSPPPGVISTTPTAAAAGNASCDYRLQASSTPEYIFSPGYPYGYASDLRCSYMIAAPIGYHVWLNFTEVNLESHNTCDYDMVTVISRESTLGVVCDNNRLPPPLRSVDNIMMVLLSTDSSVNRTGFAAQYKMVCGGLVEETVGRLQSPGFPEQYPPNAICSWTIIVTAGRTVQLDFDSFGLQAEQGGRCADSLMVYNGASTTSPPLGDGEYCGSSLPSIPASSDNEVTVVFSTDGSGSGPGFNLAFRELAVACGGQLELTASVREGIVTSPNYPAVYPQNVDCIWVITAPANERITVDFLENFGTEPHDGCEYDYVQLRDGGTSNSELLGQYCGTSKPNTLQSTGNVLYIRFRTDNSVQRDGFKIRYSIGSCGGTYFGSSGAIESPGYPGDYGANLDCEWYLTAPTGHYITFTFAAFNVEAASDCGTADFLEIREYNETGYNLGPFCGANIPASVDTSDSVAYVHFHSNAQTAFPGFRITWEASVEECGGQLTTPTGRLTSPNFPGLYPHRRRCVWYITVAQGRRVTLTFTDFNIEDHSRCHSDYVLVFNGAVRESPLMQPGFLCGTNIPGPFESSGNGMAVMFRTDGSVSGEGFAATYNSDMPAVCGGEVGYSSDGGSIASPGFHDNTNYNHSTQCVWTITNRNATDSSIQLLFQEFALESHGECGYDFVEVREGTDENGELIGRYCGNSTVPPAIASPSPTLTVRFVADYYVSDRGFRLDYFFTSCGGVLDTPGTISSPNYPENYNHGDSCAWKIVAPEGMQIRMRFSDIKIEEHAACEYDYVEIFNGGLTSSPSIGKFCGENNPGELVTQSNQARLEFHTDSSSADRGFRMTFEFNSGGCGGMFHGLDGQLTSPGYPEQYPVNTECTWDVIAEPGYHLIFQFAAPFDLQIQDQCDQDYVEILGWNSNGSYTSVGRYCGNNIPDDVEVPSYRSRIKFRSNGDINGNGFVLNYTTGCGATFTDESGTFSSPGYPNNYANNLLCNYTIIATDDPQKTIIVTFDPDPFRIEGPPDRPNAFVLPEHGNYTSNITNDKKLFIKTPSSPPIELEPAAFYYYYPNSTIPADNPGFLCIYDWIDLYQGLNTSGNQIGRFCGYSAPQPLIGRGAISLQFVTDYSITDKGWKLSYTMESCGGIYNGSSGVISTPAHPYNYLHNANCTWVITVPNSQVVDIKFNSLDIESHSSCRYDSVAIYDGDSLDANLIGRFCGDVVPVNRIRSTGSALLVQFVSDRSVGGGGFQAAYRATYGESSGCGGMLVNATQGSIESVDADNNGQYEGDLDCLWRIIVPENMVVKLHFSSFNLESSTVCERYDYVQVRDGLFASDPLVGTFCGRTDPVDFTSSSNTLYVYFHTDSDMETSGFTATYTAIESSCGGSYQVTDEPQNLTSPGYPGNYPNDARCRWTLDAPNGFQIQVKVISLEIESHDNCAYDYIEIRDSPMGDNGTNLHVCGSTAPAHNFISVGSTVQINMVTDNSGHGAGFLLMYSYASCNRSIEADNGRITSPGWPGPYPIYSFCIIDIIGPVGHKLALFFNFLHIEPHGNCNYDYLQVTDSQNTTVTVAKVCGTLLPDPIFASSNQVQLKFVTDASITYPGYDITYLSSPESCGGNLTAHLGSFSSPGYPGLYNQSAITCRWLIRVSPRKKPTLNFSTFNVGTADCTDSYIKVYNGDSTTDRRFGTYCGTDLPAELTGTGRSMLVVYHVSDTNTGNGFLANYHTRGR